MIQPPLEQDYFSLLQVPQSFEINLQKISQNFKSLQKKVHPDIYTMKSKVIYLKFIFHNGNLQMKKKIGRKDIFSKTIFETK